MDRLDEHDHVIGVSPSRWRDSPESRLRQYHHLRYTSVKREEDYGADNRLRADLCGSLGRLGAWRWDDDV
jgi:hypothetical protein